MKPVMKGRLPLSKGLRSGFVLKLLFIMLLVEFVKGALLVSVLPVYFSSVLSMSAFFLGLAFALVYIGDNVFRSPVGWFVDRWGYRITTSSGLLVMCAAVALLGWARGPVWMLFGSFLLGAGTSPLWPCVVTGTTEASGEEASGTAMSAIHAVSFVGAGAGPTTIHLFMQGNQFTSAFRICMALAAAAWLASLLLPAKAGGTIRKPSERSEKGSLKEAFRSVKANGLLYPAMFAQTFAIGLLTPVITLYAREDLSLRPNEYSVLLLTGGAAAVLLLIPVGKLTDKLGTKPFLSAGIPLSAAATVFLAYAGNRPQLFAAVIAAGLGYALLIPAWNALVAHAIPEERRGTVWGAFLTITGAGFVAGPIVSGWLWESVGHKIPFLVSGAALAVFFVLQWFISPRKPNVLR